jgi:long-chain acyl-CoA synthetase
LDEQGRLILTGRRKEIQVLSTGKNVSCALLEQALQRSPYIQQAFVIGEGRKFVAALIIPHRQKLERDLAAMRFEDLLLTPAVVSLFREQIAACQAEFAHYEQVKRFAFLDEEVLLDPELMTPTQKMRRNALERKLSPWIERMYRQEEPLVIALSALSEESHLRRPAV